MYWSDIRNGTLNRAFLNGANVEVLFHTDDPLIIDLAVDWVNEKIYWTEAIQGYMYWSDVRTGSLNRAFLNGTSAEVLLHTEDPVIDGIAVDWVNEKLYWTEAW
jgi:hypothetical protein